MPVFSSDNQPTTRGSRKGIKNTATLLKAFLNGKVTGSDGKKIKRLALLIEKQYERAKEGNTKAFNALMDRYEGKPINIIEDSNHKTLVIMPAGQRPEPGQVIHTIAKPLKEGTPSPEDDE